MSGLTDPQTVTRGTPTRFELILIDPEKLGETVNQSKWAWRHHAFENTFTHTSTVASISDLHVTSPSLSTENAIELAKPWQAIDWLSLNRRLVVAFTRGTTPTSATVNALHSPPIMHPGDDSSRRLSLERRTLSERIRKLQDKIKLTNSDDVVEASLDLDEDSGPSADLLDFCSQQGTLPHLSVALDLIEACFSSIQNLCLQPEQDPETGEEWLVLDITIQGDEEQILDAYSRYTDRWISTVPWPERNKIRLAYNII
jgi:hypothetical protein